MSHVLKKILSTFLFLLLALGSFCMSLGIHAATFESHEHNSAHWEIIDQDTTIVDHHSWDESIDCCNDIHELDPLVTKPSINNDSSETIIYSLHLYEQDIYYIILDSLRHQIFPNPPPDDIKRRKSEKNSTQLLI